MHEISSCSGRRAACEDSTIDPQQLVTPKRANRTHSLLANHTNKFFHAQREEPNPMRHIQTFLLLTAFLSGALAYAQDTKNSPPANASGAHDSPQASSSPSPTIGSAIDREISIVEKEIVEAAEAMPEDKFDFSPEKLNISGSDYKGVRTFGQQLKHVAASNYLIWSAITGEKAPDTRSEEHTSELQSPMYLVCRLLLEKKNERSGREQICEVFLSPDAFAHRTAEASIAEQLGDVLVANGLPRPAPADDDRVGGWQWMYQLLENDAWMITENCAKLIDGIPLLVRDERRIEDVRKMDGDDAADAARYGLVSGARLAGLHALAADDAPPGGLGTQGSGEPHFVHGMPLSEQIARQVSATDPTSRAIHFQRLEGEASKLFNPKGLPRRRHW